MKKSLMTIVLTALSLGSVCEAQTVIPQACEQSIVLPNTTGRYLWLPIEESAPEGKVQVIVSSILQAEHNVRMAREKVDYYIPLDLQPFRQKGVLKVCVQNVPTGSICFSKLSQNDDTQFALKDEPYRPLYHHAPLRGWMNDPNGMFYMPSSDGKGTWNLCYQYNPYGSMWGNMHWGASTTSDLVHWQSQPVALAPDVWGTIFSGSSVIDHEGTAGFGRNAVVAIYTTSRPTPFGADVQAQCIAYSTDGGRSFTKYEQNPVITSDKRDFRDPKVFWNADIKRWNLILAAGQEMQIYSSANLRDWTYESSFGSEYGAHGGVWECPDLMRLPVRGTSEQKWMLICNINPGGPFGGSATQYFVGQFDGHKFTCESRPEVTKWMDYGKDHYATVTFDNAPRGRRVALAWMSNWQYANEVPTKQFRSANSIARDLFLFRDGTETYCGVVPAEEMLTLRGKPTKQLSEACEVVVALKGASEITLTNAKGEEVVMKYDDKARTFSMDRRKSGETAFSEAFPCVTTAPTHGKMRELRIFIDRCSVEAFDGEGRMAMTNLVFPTEPYKTIRVTGKAKATVYPLSL